MSSKINEHDLEDSVFEGLALEETSQKIYNLLGGDNAGESSGGVAKAEDVQEILEKISGGLDGTLVNIAGGNYTASATVVSVQGKGKLYYALANLQCESISTKTAQFKIIIDGETVMHINCKSTQDSDKDYNYSCYVNCGIAPINSLRGGGSIYTSIGGGIFMVGNDTNVWHGIYGNVFEFSSTARSYSQTTTKSTSYGDHILFNGEYLTFNESLVVQYVYGNQTNPINVVYSLDE